MRKPIVVITRQRSGSNLLGGYLWQFDGVVAVGEVFKPKPARLGHLARRLALADDAIAQLHSLQDGDRARFWRELVRVLAAAGKRPYAKMFYGNARQDDALWAAFDDAQILHLIRENVLAAVVSKKLVGRTRIYRSDGYSSDYDGEDVAVAPEECEAHLAKLTAQIAFARGRFGHLADYLELTYDSIVDPERAGAILCRALAEPGVRLKPKASQQRRRPLSEMVSNYAQVAQYDRDFDLARTS